MYNYKTKLLICRITNKNKHKQECRKKEGYFKRSSFSAKNLKMLCFARVYLMLYIARERGGIVLLLH